MKIIRGMFHYGEGQSTAAFAGLIEHDDDRHVWLSFLTGEWPGTNAPDCQVSAHIWRSSDELIMRIEDSTSSPFEAAEVFDSYPVSRDQVLAVDGGKEWFIDTYLKLFESDAEIGSFISRVP